MKNYVFISFFVAATILTPCGISAAPVVRLANGANAAAIRTTVDQFRDDLGGNNGVGGSFTSGRREINWDDVPDTLSSPFITPGNFYNANSPRGGATARSSSI